MLHRSPPALRAVIILPDSTMRRTAVADINQDPRFEIVGDFASLAEAYARTEAHPPDLVICNRTITRQLEFPMFEAMLAAIRCTLVRVERDASASTIASLIGLSVGAVPPMAPRTPEGLGTGQRLVAIGASTGGIEALKQVLSSFPATCPPTVVVQHIKPEYLNGVVGRLDRACPAKVVAATDQFALRPGVVAFAPGLPMHLELQPRALRCILVEKPPVSGHRPSVDVLFQSAAALKGRAVGVLLTGMGRDGATGLAAMRQAGAWTIAQDAATSVVYGMPRVAAEEGAACEVLPLQKIGKAILAAATAREEISK
ncbi:chemotaxis protein CheB [Rhodobacteraceae bacterium N5(2021)]|uniref:protein-glutamate methylesterase n=1 Tax=Gymnodinialimonas phycosphaerae TaxID=2841589 RepID=A0A975YHI0_9RHOB|nr:chemotaxis protein CheB [Gymnodinialimonas phycosphaerae]